VAAGVAAALAVTVPLAVSPGHAFAAVTDDFELDGNVLDNTATPPPDWGADSGTNSIFTTDANQVGVPRNPLPAGFLSAGFSKDFTNNATSDNSTFTNGSKDTDNISTGWKCVSSNNVTDKGDIQNGYAAAFLDAQQHLILYFGLEKNAPNGDNNMGVWFLKDGTVGCNNPNGGAGLAFTGNHQNGDIFLVAAFANGGTTPTVNAYQWQGGAGGSLSAALPTTGGKCGTAGSENLCAITNDASSVTTPWLTQNKATSTPQNKTGLGTTLSPDQFYEGAIDLTFFGLDKDSQGNPVCVNKFLFNTRSSTTLGSTLFDYTTGNVQTCANPSISTNLFKKNASPPDTSLAPPNQTVTLPANVYDTATLTGTLGTPTGTVTYSLWTDSACKTAATAPTFSGGGNTATVTIVNGVIPPSPTLTFDTPGNFWWQASYSGGGRNNGATSDCSTEPLVVQIVHPTIATTPSPTTLTIGNNASFNDTATISNGYFPAGGIAPGNVTFTLYGPFTSAANIVCTGTATFTDTEAAARVDNTTASATSASFTPNKVGLYQWVASYAGNTQNASASTGCNDTTEQVTVNPATPTVATTILLSDKAKVTGITGAGAVAGSVDFQLYPNADCSGSTILHDETVTLAADGTAATGTATAANAAATYSWKVTFTPAANSNYTTASTTCTLAQSDEKAVISYAGTSPIPTS
jgi:hypothetical protein